MKSHCSTAETCGVFLVCARKLKNTFFPRFQEILLIGLLYETGLLIIKGKRAHRTPYEPVLLKITQYQAYKTSLRHSICKKENAVLKPFGKMVVVVHRSERAFFDFDVMLPNPSLKRLSL